VGAASDPVFEPGTFRIGSWNANRVIMYFGVCPTCTDRQTDRQTDGCRLVITVLQVLCQGGLSSFIDF